MIFWSCRSEVTAIRETGCHKKPGLPCSILKTVRFFDMRYGSPGFFLQVNRKMGLKLDFQLMDAVPVLYSIQRILWWCNKLNSTAFYPSDHDVFWKRIRRLDTWNGEAGVNFKILLSAAAVVWFKYHPVFELLFSGVIYYAFSILWWIPEREFFSAQAFCKK